MWVICQRIYRFARPGQRETLVVRSRLPPAKSTAPRVYEWDLGRPGTVAISVCLRFASRTRQRDGVPPLRPRIFRDDWARPGA